MANKRYDQYDPGTYDPNKIILQANPVTGALEKIVNNTFIGSFPYKLFTAAMSGNGTSAPTLFVYQNTIDTCTPTRVNTGRYNLNFNSGVSDVNKIYMPGLGDWADLANPYLVLTDSGAVVGYLTMYWPGPGNTIRVETMDASFTFADIDSLIGTTKLYLPEIRVYP